MIGFIEEPCFINFLGEECLYIPPEPPEPTAFDRIIPEANGLDDYETSFNTVVPGGIILGIVGKNNANVSVDFTVLIDDEPVTLLVRSSRVEPVTTFTYLAAVEDIPVGSHTIKITKNGTSSSGLAALRIIETEVMPNGWQGISNGYTTSPSGTAAGVAVSVNPVEIGSVVISLAGWNSNQAYPPSCATYTNPRVPQQKVRDDLIEDQVTVGFFRSVASYPNWSLVFNSANRACCYSVSMAELKGVVLRP